MPWRDHHLGGARRPGGGGGRVDAFVAHRDVGEAGRSGDGAVGRGGCRRRPRHPSAEHVVGPRRRSLRRAAARARRRARPRSARSLAGRGTAGPGRPARSGRRRESTTRPQAGADPELTAPGVERDQAEITVPVGEVAAPVVEGEKETSREPGQRRLRQQPGIERRRHRSQVRPPADQAGERRGQHVAAPGRARGTGGGRSPRSRSPPGSGSAPSDQREPAQLEVGPAGDVDARVAVLLARPRTARAARPCAAGRRGSGSAPARRRRRPTAGGRRGSGPAACALSVADARNRDAHRDPRKVSGCARRPRMTSRRLPQGPAGLRTRDHPERSAFPDLDQARSSDIVAPPVTHTAARQSRTLTGFPDHHMHGGRLAPAACRCEVRPEASLERTSSLTDMPSARGHRQPDPWVVPAGDGGGLGRRRPRVRRSGAVGQEGDVRRRPDPGSRRRRRRTGRPTCSSSTTRCSSSRCTASRRRRRRAAPWRPSPAPAARC